MGQILINCDLGENESDTRTARLLGLVDAANICCGVHAGSEAKTCKTLQKAAEYSVMIGAHPGLAADGGRGGRLPGPRAFEDLLGRQVTPFMSMADRLGLQVDYVKLHGSLYHAVESDTSYADAYLKWLHAQRTGLAVFALAGGAFSRKAEDAGLEVWKEGFADRGYRRDGSLVPRSSTGAVLDAKTALSRFEKWKSRGLMDTVDGGAIVLKADTFCVHSDSPDAETLLAGLKKLISV